MREGRGAARIVVSSVSSLRHAARPDLPSGDVAIPVADLMRQSERARDDGERSSGRTLATAVDAALVAIGAAAIAVWLILALTHLGDRYKVGHVQGHWMALARYASEGTLYPPLSDGVRFGGTRHLALPILANAAAGRLTGEFLVSGKATAVLLFAVLLLLVFTSLRRLGCRWPLALALTGLLPATNTGVLAGSAPGGDVLSVVLQIASLLWLARTVRRPGAAGLVGPAVLAGLAGCSKLTGIWALLAATSWLAARHDWRRARWFAGIACATAAVTLGLVQWISDGRFVTTFLALTFAGTRGPAEWLRAPSQLVFFGLEDAPAVWMIGPFAAIGVMAAWRSSAVTVYHHALGWALLLTLAVFTDIGAGFNQLLDLMVLTLMAVGHLGSSALDGGAGGPPASAGRLPPRGFDPATVSAAVAIAVVWAGATGVRGFVPDLRDAARTLREGRPLSKYTPRPLAGVIAPGEAVLTDDPAVPVLLGQDPIMLDAFMLRRLDETTPALADGLVARIRDRQFQHVALLNRLDSEETWWRDYHLGPRVAGALRAAYAYAGTVDGYALYAPRR